jgi:hypothetical protein
MNNINKELYDRLVFLGIIPNEVRAKNIGASNYSEHTIQPYSIWIDWDLNPWDADIVKRVLRTKKEGGMSFNQSRKMDYEKIIHICKERIRQIDVVERYKSEVIDNEKCVTYPKKVLCTKTWLMNDGDKLLEMFTENRYYNQPSEDVIMDNDNVSIYVTKENFKKYFKV